jgi:hypothetical protein
MSEDLEIITDPISPQEAIRLARERLTQGDHDGAEQSLRTARDRNPADPTLLSHYLADGSEPGPVMVFLQPGDIARQRHCAGFDAPVIGIDSLRARRRLVRRVVEKCAHVVMQCALVTFQRQNIITALIDDLLSDGNLDRLSQSLKDRFAKAVRDVDLDHLPIIAAPGATR